MNLAKVAEKLNLKFCCCEENASNVEVSGGYTSDLLSDVMGNVDENEIWITLQTHKNVVAIASLKDVAAVVFVNGLQPDADALTQSIEEGIPLLYTDDTTFDITGKLYSLLNN